MERTLTQMSPYQKAEKKQEKKSKRSNFYLKKIGKYYEEKKQ
jgi:hypothetical protein